MWDDCELPPLTETAHLHFKWNGEDPSPYNKLLIYSLFALNICAAMNENHIGSKESWNWWASSGLGYIGYQSREY